MVSYSSRRHTRQLETKNLGKTNLKEISCGVAIGYYGTNSLELKLKQDDHGRLLVIEVKIDNTALVLINIHNAITETEQLQTLSNLSSILKSFNVSIKNIIFGGDFNLFLDICLDTNGKKAALNEKSTAYLIQIYRKLRSV